MRDTGKTTRMCLESEGQRFNPSRPSQIYASLPISRCINGWQRVSRLWCVYVVRGCGHWQRDAVEIFDHQL